MSASVGPSPAPSSLLLHRSASFGTTVTVVAMTLVVLEVAEAAQPETSDAGASRGGGAPPG
jgi:hypothetical protein